MQNCNKVQLVEMPKQPIPWHAIPVEEVLVKLQTDLRGLSPAQVKERQCEFGRNTLPERKPPTLFEIILHQFKSPLIYVLLIAGALALVTGDVKDAIFILAVLVLNASIGTVQEYRAEQSAHALQKMIKMRARVRREGREFEVDAEELVPGDVVLLESGNRVPADLRLVQVNNLAIDESFLTGESIAATKKLDLLPRDAPVSDRHNMAYAGSIVVSGRGVGLVVATGRYTEVGKIARIVAEEEGAKPPLVVRMEKFARQISFVVLGYGSLLGVITLVRGMSFYETLLLIIAMAVSAIPEGLPVAMTVALSLATARMAQRNVIVRKLAAVESLGSCTVIASDKTGTLTVNQQTVRAVIFPDGVRVAISGQGYNDQGEATLAGGGKLGAELAERLKALARDAILCNEATLEYVDSNWRHSGDAMDVALLALGYKLGLQPAEVREQHPVLAVIPFESDKRYAATLNRTDGAGRVIVKGALEVVLPFCTTMQTAGGVIPLDEEAVHRQATTLAEEGYRVLALAAGNLLVDGPTTLGEEHLGRLTLQGLLGFIDPVRPEVPKAVATARQAGIKVVMITGDHPDTAFTIARELGIAESKAEVVTGRDLAEIGDVHVPQFYELVKRSTVFARVSPEQKLHIVDALVAMGEFVAVTGDGVNDAPALRKANIGVAMGSGSDVAKDTALLIVTDNNFASIVAGIEEGRHAYANVRKVTLLLISTGFAELVLIGMSIFAGLPVPLLPVQLLWLNLVTNGIQDVALAFEAGEEGVMRVPPRPPSESIFNRKMIEQLLLSGLTMALICFVGWVLMLRAGWDETSARNGLLTLLVMLQFAHVLNCRSETTSAFRVPVRNNPVLMIGMAVAFGLHILATELPFLQSLLRTQPLSWQMWLLFAVPGLAIVILMELYKIWSRRR
jgi:magnesium-transporting ATPase (P-type)